jgi:hypothetical protein
MAVGTFEPDLEGSWGKCEGEDSIGGNNMDKGTVT